MDFLARVTRIFGGGSKKSGTYDYGGTWIPLGGGKTTVDMRNLLDAMKEWVFIAVDKNATTVSGVRYKVMRYARSGDDQEVFEGPLIDFLESPAEGLTGKDFIYLNTAYKELTGNAFWEKISRGRVAPLIPNRVVPIVTDGKLIGLKYAEATTQRTIQIDDVLHDRTPDLTRPWWGAGKLQRVARWVDTSAYITEFINRFFVNGASFGGFIQTEEETEERIKLIKLGLANDHQGVENAHKWAVLPKGSEATPITAKLTDMQMGETDDRARDKILAAFGVPKTLAGFTTEVNRASAEASEYVYAKYTVKPLVDDFIEFLNIKVAPMLDPTGKYYFAYDDFIPEDLQTKVQMRQAALAQQPFMTINEVRAEVGLPPVVNGDEIYANPLLQPLGSPTPAPDPAANDNPDPNANDKPKKALPSRARVADRKERFIDELATRAMEVATAHRDPDAEAHKSFVGRVEDHEKLVAAKVRDFNNRQEREVTQRLKQITKGVQKGDLFDMDGEVGVLVDFVSPMLKGLMVEQAIAEFADQDFPGQLDSNAKRFSEVVSGVARRLAKSYNRTTALLLASALDEGIKNGEDITQLTDRVKKVYSYSDTVRAAAVARTESFYIANAGSKEAYRQSGVVKTMRWYTAEDERVCEFCGPENGRTISTSELFYPKGTDLEGADGGTLSLDYRSIDVPPLHTNCRCFVRPERIDIG